MNVNLIRHRIKVSYKPFQQSNLLNIHTGIKKHLLYPLLPH